VSEAVIAPFFQAGRRTPAVASVFLNDLVVTVAHNLPQDGHAVSLDD
jgi:hypothetical protein